jgi:hypothetical protein
LDKPNQFFVLKITNVGEKYSKGIFFWVFGLTVQTSKLKYNISACGRSRSRIKNGTISEKGDSNLIAAGDWLLFDDLLLVEGADGAGHLRALSGGAVPNCLVLQQKYTVYNTVVYLFFVNK